MNEIKLRLFAQRLLNAEKSDMFNAGHTEGIIETSIAQAQNEVAKKIGDMMKEILDMSDNDADTEYMFY